MEHVNFTSLPHILFILAFIFAALGLGPWWRAPAGSTGMPWWEISWLLFLAGMICS